MSSDDLIRFSCVCGARMKAPARLMGRSAKCPKCEASVVVSPAVTTRPDPPPKIVAARPPLPPPIEPARQSSSSASKAAVATTERIARWLIVCISVVVYLVTQSHPDAGLVHYLALIAFGLTVGSWIMSRFRPGWNSWFGGIAMVALLLFLYCPRDTVIVQWTKKDTGTRYWDRVNRFDDRPHYRSLESTDGLRSHGPMVGDHKAHGHWTTFGGGLGTEIVERWYWWGEEITEGEWHLRNR